MGSGLDATLRIKCLELPGEYLALRRPARRSCIQNVNSVGKPVPHFGRIVEVEYIRQPCRPALQESLETVIIGVVIDD